MHNMPVRARQLFHGAMAAWCLFTVFLTVSTAAAPIAHRHSRLRIYVHPIPSKYNTDLILPSTLSKVSAISIEAPFGKPLDKNLAVWDTSQYSLELWWYKQMLESPCRVQSLSEAHVVYVPIFLTYLHPTYITKEVYAATHQQVLTDLIAELEHLLPDYKTKPHFMVFGSIEAGFPEVSTIQPFLESELLASSTVLTIENFQPWQEHGWHHGLRHRSINVPYPSSFHFCAGARPCWEELPDANKSVLVFASWLSNHGSGAQLRQQLEIECEQKNSGCVFAQFDDDVPKVMHMYQSAHFCLQPGGMSLIHKFAPCFSLAWVLLQIFQYSAGDTPTRKGFWDCLLAGTIPVVMDPILVKMFPFNDIVQPEDYMIVVNLHDGLSDNVLSQLQQVTEDRRANMQLRILRGRHLFQYALRPDHSLLTFDGMYEGQQTDDAFTMSMKALMRSLCKLDRISCPGESLRVDISSRSGRNHHGKH